MSKLGLEREKERILQSSYTRGQIHALVAAEQEYNFHRLVQWINDGVDSWADSENLARVLVLREKADEPAPQFLVAPQNPSPVPDRLILKGLSGSARRPFALVNNATFSIGEEGSVRVGSSNVMVRCLAITNNAITIQVRGEAAPRQLKIELK